MESVVKVAMSLVLPTSMITLPPGDGISTPLVPFIIWLAAMLPSILTLPVTSKSPVMVIVLVVSLTAITAFPLLLEILVTVVVVVISRTSMISPVCGASVNVNTQVGSVPATA